jgi:predicted small lipoprotein YifL
MKKMILSMVALSLSATVLAGPKQHLPLPNNSKPISQIAQTAEKNGVQVYAIKAATKQGYYVVAGSKNQQFIRQHYDLKTGKLLADNVQKERTVQRNNHRAHGQYHGEQAMAK